MRDTPIAVCTNVASIQSWQRWHVYRALELAALVHNGPLQHEQADKKKNQMAQTENTIHEMFNCRRMAHSTPLCSRTIVEQSNNIKPNSTLERTANFKVMVPYFRFAAYYVGL
jgi:hypothetical protein